MPFVARDTKALIALWMRCRDRQALPEPGGVTDQPEGLMQAFDWIDAAVSHFQQQQAEESKREIAAADALRRMQRGH